MKCLNHKKAIKKFDYFSIYTITLIKKIFSQVPMKTEEDLQFLSRRQIVVKLKKLKKRK
jgi:hypothetical protein